MTDHEKKAADLFLEGLNCSQSVFTAFDDVTGFTKEQSMKMSSCFGGGFGRMREMCGAVCGMTLALSCIYGYTDIVNPQAKTESYALTSCLINKFANEMGSYVCRDILKLKSTAYSPVAEARTKEFYEKRPCLRCIKTAARLLDEVLNEQ